MYKFLMIIVFGFLSYVINAQERKITWDYPVKFGTDEWEALKTVEE